MILKDVTIVNSRPDAKIRGSLPFSGSF